jgi:hypothetical protein
MINQALFLGVGGRETKAEMKVGAFLFACP